MFEDKLREWLISQRDDNLRTWLHEHVRSAWRRGDHQERVEILTYLLLQGPRGFLDLVEEALADPNDSIRYPAFSIVQKFASKDREVLTPLIVNILLSQLQSGAPHTQFLALLALPYVPGLDIDPYIREFLTSTKDDSLRTTANMILAESGDVPALQEVLRYLQKYPKYYGVARRVWLNRARLPLAPSEIMFLRERLNEYCSSIEEQIRNGDTAFAETLAELRNDDIHA